VSHSRARLNAFGRRLLCERIAQGFPVRIAARILGISHARAYIIWHRYTAEGERAFEPRSSRPHRSRTRLAAGIEARIERARRKRRWGPLRLHWLFAHPPSMICGAAPARHQAPARPRCGPRRRALRARGPGDFIHVDTKKIGRLAPGGGKRFWKITSTHCQDAPLQQGAISRRQCVDPITEPKESLRRRRTRRSSREKRTCALSSPPRRRRP
jgi:hypothetical protein